MTAYSRSANVKMEQSHVVQGSCTCYLGISSYLTTLADTLSCGATYLTSLGVPPNTIQGMGQVPKNTWPHLPPFFTHPQVSQISF